MATVEERFPGKWLKAEDLDDEEHVVKIISVDTELLREPNSTRDKEKLVLTLSGFEKRLILNKTNFGLIAEILGADDDEWRGGRK